MKKSILILGAGVYQVPAIQKARKMGLKTIVLSYNIKNYPGYKYADIPLEVDTTDIKRVLKVAREYKVGGVFTTGTDVALKALGAVNEKLGLCGPSAKACELSTNKSVMKEKFIQGDVPTARYFEARNFGECTEAADKIGFPVMIKAVNSSGSRGISKVENMEGLKDAWKYSKENSKNGDPVIIEEYLEGVEFGAQAFVFGGDVKLVCPHNDTVTPPPYSTPIGHSYPFEKLELLGEIRKVVISGIKALGIDNSAANIDLILTNDGPKILEIGARMGATCLPELTAIYTGIDVLKECIKISMGETPSFTQIKNQPVAGLLLTSKKSGKVINILAPSINAKNGTKIIKIDVSKDDPVHKFHVGPDRIGEVIVLGNSYADAEREAKKVVESIKVAVK